MVTLKKHIYFQNVRFFALKIAFKQRSPKVHRRTTVTGEKTWHRLWPGRNY